jgi:Chromo (CHRromatin Organisation MOdifier) domain
VRRAAVASGAEYGVTSLIGVPQVLVKWRQLGYDLATWETLPDLSKVDGAEAELERFHALHPIADEAEHVQKVLLVIMKRMYFGWLRQWNHTTLLYPISTVRRWFFSGLA